jgi:hypothetical protein
MYEPKESLKMGRKIEWGWTSVDDYALSGWPSTVI